MKINEVILNEGVLGSLVNAAGKALTGTGQANDWLGTQMQKFGAVPMGTTGTQNIFLKNFVQEYNTIAKSAKASGMQMPDMKTYVTDYLEQQGWSADEPTIDKITSSSGNDINKVANAMYMIGMRQKRNKNGQVQQRRVEPTMGQGAAGGGISHSNEPTMGAPAMSSSVKQIISAITRMSSETDEAGLEEIAKAAMQKLYKLSKSEYAELRQEILTGKKAQTAATKPGTAELDADHDRLATGTNESIRKTRKI